MRKLIASLLLALALGTGAASAQTVGVTGKVWEFKTFPGWGNGICVGTTHANCQWGWTTFVTSNDGGNLLLGALGTTVTMTWNDGTIYIYAVDVSQ